MRIAGAPTTLFYGLLAGALLVSTVLISISPAQARMGRCKPDKADGLICGSGTGSARVIDGTISPNKRFAFAWRNPTGDTTDEPGSDGPFDLLLLRLADGKILATAKTEYWDSGKTHANHMSEAAVWSPDSRLAARSFDTRYETQSFELYALGADGASAATFDVQKLVEPLVRAKAVAPDTKSGAFSVAPGDTKVAIGNGGEMKLSVMVWVPKMGPEEHFDVTLRIARDKGRVDAAVVSIEKTAE
jgi:hypothetical protein